MRPRNAIPDAIALVTTFLVGSRPGTRAKNAVLALGNHGTFRGIFIPIYNNLIHCGNTRPPFRISLLNRQGEGYLASNSSKVAWAARTLADGHYHRAIEVPEERSVQGHFRIGHWQRSRSSLGPQFTGPYNPPSMRSCSRASD